MKAAKPYESIHAIYVGKKLEVISFINCKEWIPKKYNGIKNRVVSDTSFMSSGWLCVTRPMHCREVNHV